MAMEAVLCSSLTTISEMKKPSLALISQLMTANNGSPRPSTCASRQTSCVRAKIKLPRWNGARDSTRTCERPRLSPASAGFVVRQPDARAIKCHCLHRTSDKKRSKAWPSGVRIWFRCDLRLLLISPYCIPASCMAVAPRRNSHAIALRKYGVCKAPEGRRE